MNPAITNALIEECKKFEADSCYPMPKINAELALWVILDLARENERLKAERKMYSTHSGQFLKARTACIHEFHKDGLTDEQIRYNLSFQDADHVKRVREATAAPEQAEEE